MERIKDIHYSFFYGKFKLLVIINNLTAISQGIFSKIYFVFEIRLEN